MVEIQSPEDITLTEGTKINTPEKKNVGQIINVQRVQKLTLALITLENDFLETDNFLINDSNVTFVIN